MPYAVVFREGNELFDSEYVAHLAPDRDTAMSFAKKEAGAFTLKEAIAERRRKNEEYGEPEFYSVNRYAELYALSPGLYWDFQAEISKGNEYTPQTALQASWFTAGAFLPIWKDQHRYGAPTRRRNTAFKKAPASKSKRRVPSPIHAWFRMGRCR